MSLIKEAADRLVKKGTMTQAEYDLLEKDGMFKEGGALSGLLNASLEKMPGFVQKFVVPAGAVLGTGIAARELVLDPIMDRRRIDKSFAAMPTKVPQLAAADPQQMRDYFDVIKTFSPRSASNPLVAGALVNKMMEFGGVDHKLVQDLNDIEGTGKTNSVFQKIIDMSIKGMGKSGTNDDSDDVVSPTNLGNS